MNWQALSPAGQTLVQEIRAAESAWLGRTRRMTATLEALAALGEPAAVVPLAAVLLDVEPAVAQAAAVALERLWMRLPPAWLPILDWAMRREWWSGMGPTWPPIVPNDLNRLPQGVVSPALPLGLLSMHPSGHVRQAALVRLDGLFAGDDDGGKLSFLLLRLDDWVPAVRQQAEAAVRHRLTAVDRGAYLQHLDLLGRLRQRLRSSASDVLARVESLLGEDLPALLAASLVAGTTSSTRRYGLGLVWRAASALGQPPLTAQTVLGGMLAAGTDPAVRVFAARRVLAALSGGEEEGDNAPSRWGALLPRLLADPSAAVRRLALAWAAEREGARHLPALRAALLDPSPPARALAQFHLPRLEPGGMDLGGFYRAEVERRAMQERGDADRGRTFRAALAGLGECGQPEDDERLLPFACPGVPVGMRRVALAALARLGSTARHMELFWAALQEGAPGLSRQARRALEPLAAHLGAGRLGVLRHETPHPHVRTNVVLLVGRLPKWRALPLLLEAAGRPEDDPSGVLAARLLHGWLEGYNRTYAVRPTPAEVQTATGAMERHGGGLDPRVARELTGLLASLRG